MREEIMKKLIALCLTLGVLLHLCACTEPTGPHPITPNSYTPYEQKVMKAVWLSQFDMQNVYRDGDAQRDEKHFSTLVRNIFYNLKSDGYNTVIVQLRPYGDSFYPSAFFPPSDYVTGLLGREMTYDPFAVLVDLAHEQNLAVHGWINPLRGMKEGQITQVDGKFPIRQWYDQRDKRGEYIVLSTENRWYLNPAYQEVRDLIAKGAAEIASAYNVDGIHIDDYFYPVTDPAFDQTAFQKYMEGGGAASLAEWRRDNISQMVGQIYQSVKAVNPKCLFGVSPAGNMTNVMEEHYADVKTWCSQPGYLDYICPQIYFGMEHQTHDFQKVCKQWCDIVTEPGVRLMVGMTLGKAIDGKDVNAGSGANEWAEKKDVLKRCVEHLTTLEKCSGFAFFCYQYMYDPVSGAPRAELQQEKDHFLPVIQAYEGYVQKTEASK